MACANRFAHTAKARPNLTCDSCLKHLQARYSVSVEVASIESSLKGDLDGIRILVADHNTDEERFFLAAHLFGHTVQWNLSAELRRLGWLEPVGPPNRLHRSRLSARSPGSRGSIR